MSNEFLANNLRYAWRLVLRVERWLDRCEKLGGADYVFLHPVDYCFLLRCGVHSYKGLPLKTFTSFCHVDFETEFCS